MHHSSVRKIQKDALLSTKQNWFLVPTLATHILKPEWYTEGGMAPVQRRHANLWSVTFFIKKTPSFLPWENGMFFKRKQINLLTVLLRTIALTHWKPIYQITNHLKTISESVQFISRTWTRNCPLVSSQEVLLIKLDLMCISCFFLIHTNLITLFVFNNYSIK